MCPNDAYVNETPVTISPVTVAPSQCPQGVGDSDHGPGRAGPGRAGPGRPVPQVTAFVSGHNKNANVDESPEPTPELVISCPPDMCHQRRRLSTAQYVTWPTRHETT